MGALADAGRALDELGRGYALAGGIAVSVRAQPRLTRDVDLVVAVADDRDAERLIRDLGPRGYSVAAIVEQEATGRISTVRLQGPRGVVVDLVLAACGIEPEVVARATPVEILEGLRVPVARAEELLAMKVLSIAENREQDSADARWLIEMSPGLDLSVVRANLDAIRARGYARRQDLAAKLAAVIARAERAE